jgi:hypothetical protein
MEKNRSHCADGSGAPGEMFAAADERSLRDRSLPCTADRLAVQAQTLAPPEMKGKRDALWFWAVPDPMTPRQRKDEE